MKQGPAVFIDKDGTLLRNVPYNVDPARISFQAGAGAALAALSAAGFLLVVVTNQSGLERGYFSRAQFAHMQAVLEQRLWEEHGVTLADVQVCPHAPGALGRPKCLCRKPAPGMLVRAARQHGIDLSRSWMVGDILDDVEAGRRAGCRTVLFDSGGETEWRRTPLRMPDHVCHGWDEVVHEILAGQLAPPTAMPEAVKAWTP